MWNSLRIVVFLFPLWPLALILSTPLPICRPDAFTDIPAYFLPKSKMMGCGLPLSRQYLFSQFNAALVIETAQANKPLYNAKTLNSVVLSVCQPAHTHLNLWKDKISVIRPTPWDVQACNRAEINLHARLVSLESFQPAFIRPLKLVDRCAFSIEFTPTVPGKYHLEVVNTWLAASTDPNPLSSHTKLGHFWTGGQNIQFPRALVRGSFSIMSCEDLCSLFPQCEYWTSFGKGLQCCHFFSELVAAGVRKNESYSPYLGGMVSIPHKGNKAPVVKREECRQQAHAANSPFPLTVVSESAGMSTEPLETCSAEEVQRTGVGRWQSFNVSSCHPDSRFELAEMKLKPNVLVQSSAIDGVKYAMHQDLESLAIYYRVTRPGREVEYSFRAPRGWFPEQALTPPWQLTPRCTLGPVAVPPSTMDMRGVVTRVISFAYVRNALTGFEYISPKNCRYRHYSRGQIRRCINSNNISSVISSGDSVIGGLAAVLKWIIGVNAQTSSNWYDPARKHVVSQASVPISGHDFTFGGLKCHLKSYKKCLQDIKSLPQDQKSFIIINWNLQHLVWGQSLAKAKKWVSNFYMLFQKSRNAGEISSELRFIFVNGMALHGFREPYCTQTRSQRFSAMIEGPARAAGWLVLDAYNMTLLRTDMSYDGMHYNDAMNYMFAQVIINMMCT